MPFELIILRLVARDPLGDTKDLKRIEKEEIIVNLAH